MPSDAAEQGAALLVAGYGAPSGSALHTLGEIGATFLASSASWQVRRLSVARGERHAPDRVTLRRFLDELTEQPVGVAALVICGQMSGRAPALVTGPLHREYPEDATVGLGFVRDRLRAARAEHLLVVVSAHGDGAPADWLAALRTDLPNQAIVVAGAPTAQDHPLLDALLDGLRGAAIDPGSGAVTLRSIGAHLAGAIPDAAVQGSSVGDSRTLANPPPLGALGTVRLERKEPGAPAIVGKATATKHLEGAVLPGRFRVDRLLARGSFGAVYLARQLSIDRDVAVKVLDPGIDPTSEDGRLFVHEIQSVGRIDHPNVVRIYQADVTPQGQLYFAMELLVGADLQQIVERDQRLGRDRAVALCRQLLAGLRAVHDAGLVHADVKPANAFVTTPTATVLSPASGEERVVLIDFGLSRLRPASEPASSIGGTPAYMAPEQLENGRVDARSDIFSAALVLVTLLTGWRRRTAKEIVPPPGLIEDRQLAAVLARALALDPADRFQSAADFSAALVGAPAPLETTFDAPRPFRHLTPLTERDQGALHGRERDLTTLSEHAIYRRAVIYTGTSGVGKTSLLRAGLVPRLEALGARAVYVACRAGGSTSIAAAIAPEIWAGAGSLDEAIAAFHRQRRRKLVLILDQFESVQSDEILAEVLAFERWPADADVTVILGVREDAVGRLLGSDLPRLEEGLSIVRLGPLDDTGTREAIVAPLAAHRLAISPELLELLLGDLKTAARSLGADLGWPEDAAAYPPHLQLAGSVLYEALAPGETTITVAHYRRFGGLDAIVGEHLERVLDSDFDAAAAAAARDLFVALVTSAHGRAFRTTAELTDAVEPRHRERVPALLEILRARGLLVHVRATGGEVGWELVHDSLVPRVLGWIDRNDLDRRRAVELLRYHLRRSRPEAPSLLNRRELRELRGHERAITELDGDWQKRSAESGLTPSLLVTRSRGAIRARLLGFIGVIAALLLVAGVASARWLALRAATRREESLRDRDLGRFALELRPFDEDGDTTRPVAARDLPDLSWKIVDVAEDDAHSPGAKVLAASAAASDAGEARIDHVEARGGAAFLIVSGRNRRGEAPCPPSIVPLAKLPGYATRTHVESVLKIGVPTCAVGRAQLIEIPAGLYIHGGLGEPPSDLGAQYPQLTVWQLIWLPRYFIDRTEVSNAAFSWFAQLDAVTGVRMPAYADDPLLNEASTPHAPVAGIDWFEARAYCRFVGKELPTSTEWEKAMRGGVVLPDGTANPMPTRNLPWGAPRDPVPANIHIDNSPHTAAVGSHPGDVSLYGVLDLAGSVMEWTDSLPPREAHPLDFRVTRGGDWMDSVPDGLIDDMSIENRRALGNRTYALGMRCALASQRNDVPRQSR